MLKAAGELVDAVRRRAGDLTGNGGGGAKIVAMMLALWLVRAKTGIRTRSRTGPSGGGINMGRVVGRIIAVGAAGGFISRRGKRKEEGRQREEF